jgi:TonB family protein
MGYLKRVLLIFTFFFLASVSGCASEGATLSPEELISRARLQEELWAEGTPPMFLRAELQVSDGKGHLVKGDYTFDWASPSKWREEIRFENYVRLRVGDAKGYWQRSGPSYQPEAIFELDKLLEFKDAIKVEANQTLGKVINRKNAGVSQPCTDVKWPSGTERRLCFDHASGSLVSIEYPTLKHQTPFEISRIEYSAFNAVAGKLVPYEIRALKGRKVVAEVRVVEIAKLNPKSPGLFKVPANAEFWAQCNDMKKQELENRVVPRYPASARANHEQGRVIVYAVVEPDGSLSHLTIIQAVAPDLDAAAVEAIRQWHFKPAACGQTPIRVETSIGTDFWLEY